MATIAALVLGHLYFSIFNGAEVGFSNTCHFFDFFKIMSKSLRKFLTISIRDALWVLTHFEIEPNAKLTTG